MKIDPEKFALAVVQSLGPNVTIPAKLLSYEQAYELAEKKSS
ncbi:unnamed protein product [Fructobacillus tropaeoli]|nr:unnamed protein product [Fructobacillus tropaeoli]